MYTISEKKRLHLVSWTARIIGLIRVLIFIWIVLAFLVDPDFGVPQDVLAAERIGFTGVMLIMTGLLVAWKWDGIGALMIFIGYTTFTIVIFNMLRFAFTIFPIIGAMHGWCWWKKKRDVNGEKKL